jgi:hypothetical protein
MKEYVDKIFNVMETAKKQLEECEKFDDTEGQREAFERAQAAYDAIVKLYNDCLEAEKEATQCETDAAEAVGKAKDSNTNAELAIKAIDQVIEQLKILIEAAGGDGGDGDCDSAEKIQKTADQHLSDASENHLNAKEYRDAIGGHATTAADHYMIVMNVKEEAVKTLEAAKLDEGNVDKLKMHLEAAE